MCLGLLILSARHNMEELRHDLQRVFVCSQRHKQEYARNPFFFHVCLINTVTLYLSCLLAT